MELEFKPDFEEVRQRWSKFWKGESTRPLVHIVLPKEGVEPVPHPPYLTGRRLQAGDRPTSCVC